MRLLLFSAVFLAAVSTASNSRSFTVDYEKNTFMKDGEPFRYISGCMHYFRVPKVYWRDRLLKMKAGGLDAVETYIPWNFHWKESMYDFTEQRNVTEFLSIVQEVGLLAIVRGFPYSCAEWDMGGLPFWLMSSKFNTRTNPIKLRSYDSKFMGAVEEWFKVILPVLKPMIYANNGPIIMVQVENEYGSYYAHDKTYMKSLYKTMSDYFNHNVVLFTTDGNNANLVENGGVSGALSTIDFGPGSNPKSSFDALRKIQPKGPIVNSEFYTGWLDHWGEPSHHRTSSQVICSTLDAMLSMNASVNFYMYTGGTNFGYWSGANYPPFKQVTTSYDYDSPVSETGDTTEKYFKIRETIAKYKKLPSMPIPANISRKSYGKIEMTYIGPFWQYLERFCQDGYIESLYPLSFEDLMVLGGYVQYEVKIPALPKEYMGRNLTLVIENQVRDFAGIYINELHFIGKLQGGVNNSINLGFLKSGDTIQIVAESRGRIGYGSHINDSKGIDGTVKLTAEGLSDVMLNYWRMCHLKLENLANSKLKIPVTMPKNGNNIPGIYIGQVKTPTTDDTFIDFSGGNWTSGYAFANGINIGKFEPGMGPQQTLYVPVKAILHDRDFVQILLFEASPNENCSAYALSCTIELTNTPKLG